MRRRSNQICEQPRSEQAAVWSRFKIECCRILIAVSSHERLETVLLRTSCILCIVGMQQVFHVFTVSDAKSQYRPGPLIFLDSESYL